MLLIRSRTRHRKLMYMTKLNLIIKTRSNTGSDLCKVVKRIPSINNTGMCSDKKCMRLHLVGEFDAGKGYDKTGKQKFPKLLSEPQREARRLLLNNFENSDFLTFLEGIREKNKVEHVEKIMHADISAGNGTILLDQDKSAKGVEMPVNTAQRSLVP